MSCDLLVWVAETQVHEPLLAVSRVCVSRGQSSVPRLLLWDTSPQVEVCGLLHQVLPCPRTLLCISLRGNEVECFSYGFVCSFYIFFKEISIQAVCSFLR